MYIHYLKLSFIISLILHVIMGSVSLGSLFCSCWVSKEEARLDGQCAQLRSKKFFS